MGGTRGRASGTLLPVCVRWAHLCPFTGRHAQGAFQVAGGAQLVCTGGIPSLQCQPGAKERVCPLHTPVWHMRRVSSDLCWADQPSAELGNCGAVLVTTPGLLVPKFWLGHDLHRVMTLESRNHQVKTEKWQP